jgi:hypothetical protein
MRVTCYYEIAIQTEIPDELIHNLEAANRNPLDFEKYENALDAILLVANNVPVTECEPVLEAIYSDEDGEIIYES